MKDINYRLYFIDAMRAWAILMMLQGHFIDGLLDPVYKDKTLWSYSLWRYFRGMTAPVFFTVSGFIFTYLLIRSKQFGIKNPRVQKGVRRGIQLIIIGYLLRTNILGILTGNIYNSFYLVDVLHCIGLSILGIIGMYILSSKTKPMVFTLTLLLITLVLFLFEPTYKLWTYSNLPNALANYLTRANGSVFTIIPWFGYATFGGFMSSLFYKYKEHKNLYPTAIITCTILGLVLLNSSRIFYEISAGTNTEFLVAVYSNNYLFIHLGDVLLIFAVFMLFRTYITHKIILKIGQNTLSIYVIHFIILYGSFTGLGLYQFFKYSLSPTAAIVGAAFFVLICTLFALGYDKHELNVKTTLNRLKQSVWKLLNPNKN
ncbi:DUF1624 domain-containing protein [Cellulophaga sp. F20128]|uniref:heparan-alpha-glucosaminide N-acetyltransferase domain-containing protein n=1 Tax=Cellulophaga sp. F20128 TaxID=2926413 RepID=UPI001FF4953A|nr:heparan-alpha-glucosaminide N-acetyltransferase domain-containing protein [Cellulophaga sp. F20128]MCK0157817.1 DUF1624 domain-containing protein [Cellulophaga sp. F20128]